MKNLHFMMDVVKKQEELHRDEVYNYVIPESWNIYGYQPLCRLRNHQIMVNPYSFYAFTLQHMFHDMTPVKDPVETDRSWLRRAIVYGMMIRSFSAWDHDRDNVILHDNLYHLSDNGTFLKSMILLPMLKRMGVNTILLYQPFALGKTQKAHDYAPREAVYDFHSIDDHLADPILEGMSSEQQFAAFTEACHYLGMRVILEYCPAMMARDNVYLKDHPDWFYWIDSEALHDYHAPQCHTLPQNTMPYSYTLKDLYRSDDVKQHIAAFRKAPEVSDALELADMEQAYGITIAPSIVDQINASIPADLDTTIFRFYDDTASSDIQATASYMLQDTIRRDLYAGKKPLSDCFKELTKTITWYQKTFHIDGIMLAKPYLLPVKLQKDLVKTARRNHPAFVMMAEDSANENSEDWLKKGYDMISGNSGYEESNVWDYKFHNFAYRLKGNACTMFAASEFHDSRRIASLEHGATLSIMLSVMNYFLPNGIPMLMNGIESFDVQPMQLSVYGDSRYIRSLPKEDPRYMQQSWLDQYYYDYLAYNLSLLPNLLERVHQIRNEYLTAIIDAQRSIPVWFDSPKDLGIGFTFIMEDRALMVVCNVNVADDQQLHIHTDNMFPNLSRMPSSIKQIFSTCDPYVQDVHKDDVQNLPLYFAPGEVKFIEFR